MVMAKIQLNSKATIITQKRSPVNSVVWGWHNTKYGQKDKLITQVISSTLLRGLTILNSRHRPKISFVFLISQFNIPFYCQGSIFQLRNESEMSIKS